MTNDATLFVKDDSAIGFHARHVRSAELLAAVRQALFGENCALSEEQDQEARAVTLELRETGEFDFEDGWMKLAVGREAAFDLLMQKVTEAKAEARFEDERRYSEYQRAQRAEAAYAQLRAALTEALGDKVIIISG